MSSFSRDVSRWSKKTGLSVDQTVRGIAVSLFSSIIRDTRVDTGRLTGNWQTSAGAPMFAETERLDPSGNAAIAEVIERVDGKQTNYLTNNLPYAEVWEERDAMVGRNMARVQRIVKEEAAKRV